MVVFLILKSGIVFCKKTLNWIFSVNLYAQTIILTLLFNLAKVMVFFVFFSFFFLHFFYVFFCNFMYFFFLFSVLIFFYSLTFFFSFLIFSHFMLESITFYFVEFCLKLFKLKTTPWYIRVRPWVCCWRSWCPELVTPDSSCPDASTSSPTVWCSQVGTVLAEMSSWIALTLHIRSKTAF